MMRAVLTYGVQRAVFTALARAGGLGLSSHLRFTGAGLRVCTFFTQAKGWLWSLASPYRGAVAGRMCGPHLPLLDLRRMMLTSSRSSCAAFFSEVRHV